MLEFAIALFEGAALTVAGLNTVWRLQSSGYTLRDFFNAGIKYFAASFIIGGAALLAWILRIDEIWLEPALSVMLLALSVSVRHKPPLSFTPRVIRQLAATLFVLTAAGLFLPLWAVAFPLHFWAALGWLVMLPWENFNNRRYLKSCAEKISGEKYKKIAVVGSYAKTTVKTFLAALLMEKYAAAATPGSVNTPLGIARLVNTGHFDGAEVAVFEFGARKKGDIASLTSMVAPDIAVITGISPQHIQTFKTVENIIAAKTEVLRIMPAGKTAVINGLDRAAESFGGIGKSKKIFCGRPGDKVYAENITLSQEGARFDLVFEGERTRCSTALLGGHNITNICMAAAAAYELGVSPDEIASGVSKLKPAKHRLETIITPNGTIIDDSYNANLEGVRAAADVLKLFAGKKFVITQGIVEGGKLQRELNVSAGRILGGAVDKATVVGKNSRYLAEGLALGGLSGENIINARDVAEAVELIKNHMSPDSVLLFQNDLPK